MNCSLPDSSVHGIFQARILKWVAIPFSRVSFQPRNQTCISYISCISGQVLYLGSLRSRERCYKVYSQNSPSGSQFFSPLILTSYLREDRPRQRGEMSPWCTHRGADPDCALCVAVSTSVSVLNSGMILAPGSI